MDQHPAMAFFAHTHTEFGDSVPQIRERLKALAGGEEVHQEEIDQLLARVDDLRERVEEHFRMEEIALFPILIEARPELEGPITGLLAEHDDMRYCLNALHRALAREGGAEESFSEATTYAEKYVRSLTEHAAFEDRTLYRYASEHLGKEQLNRVMASIEAIHGSPLEA